MIMYYVISTCFKLIILLIHTYLYNKVNIILFQSLLTWMQQTHTGIKGIVMSQLTGKPIPNAILNILGRENTFNTTINGEYWKILLPGVYKLRVCILITQNKGKKE